MDINYQGSGGGIPRKTAKIFASNAEENRITVFGSTLAGDTEYTTDIANIQNEEFESGWDGAVISNKNYPLLTDMNGVQKTTSQQIAYILQHGLAEYDANTTYYTYDICNVGGIIYISLQDANKGHNPTSSPTYWSVYYDPSTLSKGLVTGQTIFSLDPLIDAGLHLLDGSLLTVGGAYDSFITNYVIPLYSAHPERFKTEQQWQQIATEYGACGYYVYNQGVSVRLPKVTGHIEGTLDPDELGFLIRAGLPEIAAHTHTFSGITGNQNATHTHTGTTDVQGNHNHNSVNDGGGDLRGIGDADNDNSLSSPTSYAGSHAHNVATGTESTNHGHAYSGTTDAAGGQSTGIYGRSDTVQTQSILGYYYIVVANSTKTDIEVDIDEIATDLNNKADKDLSNVSSISASSVVAQKDLSNLSLSGQAILDNKLNKQMITNCFTEIPQKIKLELNNGTLTLKAGSKVTVPNGFESDGTTPKFNEVEIESDITLSGRANNDIICFDADNNTLYASNAGASGSLTPATNTWFYNTSTNLLKRYSNGSPNTGKCSFPLCMVSNGGTTYSSIDQIFQGIGYIGSTVWVDKGVKGLIPDGRNADGSLKNIEFETEKVLTRTFTAGTVSKTQFCLMEDYSLTEGADVQYNEAENINHYGYGETRNFMTFGSSTQTNGVISNFRTKTAFHALDYNDSSTISGWSMPSNNYINLSLGASGTVYTAPATGWVTFYMAQPGQHDLQVFLSNESKLLRVRTYQSVNDIACYIPVVKGDKFKLEYTYNSNSYQFRFIYAEGEV